jgi:hypothetical protein
MDGSESSGWRNGMMSVWRRTRRLSAAPYAILLLGLLNSYSGHGQDSTFVVSRGSGLDPFVDHSMVPVFVNRQLAGTLTLISPPGPTRLFPGASANVSILAGQPANVDPFRSLLIHDLKVVEDWSRAYDPGTNQGTPLGKWTFGRLLSAIAAKASPPITPSRFVEKWLENWKQDVTVNGETVNHRSGVANVFEAWSYFGSTYGSGPRDVGYAPFRLLAIVNRVDLRDLECSAGDAGEARFVFCAIKKDGTPLPFTVILEYHVDCGTGEGTKQWGQDWVNLARYDLGASSYLSALETLTDRFSLSGRCGASTTDTALGQLRTNDNLADPWNLREFRLDNSGQLNEVVARRTPRQKFIGQTALASYINATEAGIMNLKYEVPATLQGQPFAAGLVTMRSDPPVIWNAPGIHTSLLRHTFALNTCSGCHMAETGAAFQHIGVRKTNERAKLSGFLTGAANGSSWKVTDPVDATATHEFNDLLWRQSELDLLVRASMDDIRRHPLPRMPH